MTYHKIPFDTAVKDATGGNCKVQRRAYLTTGDFPIIDQGQGDSAGYTNDVDALYQGKLPVVLFGDHTRCFKYVEKPFALGADGVKVLTPRKGFNAKFLYYYFLSLDLPNRGYSRHFKFLKEMPIPVVPPSEQLQIVELLDQANRLQNLGHNSTKNAACILPALFIKMFGDPATNPMSWPIETLGSLADGRPEYGANARGVERKAGMPRYVRITDIDDDGLLREKGDVSLDTPNWEQYRLADGDVLFARSGNTVGKSYQYRVTDGDCAFAGYLIRFRFRSGRVSPWFISCFTRTAFYRNWVESSKRVAGQPNINGQEYASLRIPVPPKELQEQFARQAENVSDHIVSTKNAAKRIDKLYQAMLQQAFSGSLTAKWRDAHSEIVLAEMSEQTRLLMPRSASDVSILGEGTFQ